MTVAVIPENVLKLMSKADRKQYGKAGRTHEEIVKEVSGKLEREIQKDIIGFLRTRDIFVLASRFGKRTTTACGTPDISFVWNGLPYAFEVKTDSGSLTKEQINVAIAMQKDGWHWHLVRSVQQAKEILDKQC